MYDNNGNIVKRREFVFTLKDNTLIEELESTDKVYVYNGDQMVSYNGQTCVYDDMGNPTTYRNMSCVWEKGRQLKSISDGANTVSFTYDEFGMRTTKTAGGITTNYVYENGKLLREVTGSEKIDFVYGSDGIIGFRTGNKNYLYRKNVFGDVTEIYSDNGTLVGKYSYTAFGECIVKVNEGGIAEKNPIRYRGYYYDEEMSLYYLKSRYYDPVTGRFITIDDISYIDPETINGLNLYAYCGNNPVMNIDPNGRFLFSFLASLAIAALIGACVGVVGTLLSDVVTSALNGNWQFSSWETYLGSAIGGAVGGVVSLFSPFLGAVLAGTISTAAGNIIGKITGSNTASWGEILIDVGFSAVISVATAGMGKYLRISPITKGSHSFQQVFKSGFTKALKYHFSMSAKTLAKEAGYLIVSGFTTGFLASNIVQGIYNVGKTRVKQWLDWINSMRTFSSANFY